jgi:hypothetical protein
MKIHLNGFPFPRTREKQSNLPFFLFKISGGLILVGLGF